MATYVVQPGDTLAAIAERHGTDWQTLAELNQLANPNLIFPGQELALSDGSPPEQPSTPCLYIVKPGDTLSDIAAQFGTTWWELAQLNHITNPNLIFTDQQLVVPCDQPGSGPPEPEPPGSFYVPVVRNATKDPAPYWTSGGTHGGYPAADIFAPAGSPIFMPEDGVVKDASNNVGGKSCLIQADQGGRWYYMAHGNRPFDLGHRVQGQVIGEVGNSGNAIHTHPHLHLALSRQGPQLFDLRAGSGDYMGDASWWRQQA